MSERNKNRCAVLLPPGQHFERLFDEILEFAILDTGLIPFRLQHRSQSPIPINVFVEEIEQAGALFADISEHVPEIWMAVGCAAALGSPLCLISSRHESSLPLGIEHLPLIAYPAHAFPADYIQLQQNITAQLSAIMPRPVRAEPESEDYAGLMPSIPYPELSEDLVSYEILALTIIDLKASDAGLSPRALGIEMQASESGHLTSHAMNALRRRRFIERKPVQISEGDELHISENLFLTRDGEDWLIRHGKRTPAHRSRIYTRAQFTSSR
jgi:hypothetical protein